MQYRQIDDKFAVSGQIATADVAEIARAGFKSIICNRPDTEDGAIPHETMARAAAAAGLEFRFIPVVSGGITPDDVEVMAAAIGHLPQPVFAYCRSGARSANLYAMASGR